MSFDLLQVPESPRFRRALPQRQGARSCPVVAKAGRLGGLGEIVDLTADWSSRSAVGTSTPYWPYSTAVLGGSLYVLELRGTPIVFTREDAVNLIETVGHWLNFKKHKPWNILGFLVVTIKGQQIVQFVIDYAEHDENWVWGETLIDFCEEMAKVIADARPEWSKYVLANEFWWMLTEKDARYWTPEGGIAPLWTYVKDNNGPTKSLKQPLPGQIVEGALVQNIGQGHPLAPKAAPSGDKKGETPDTTGDEAPDYMVAAVVAVLIIAAAIWASAGGERR